MLYYKKRLSDSSDVFLAIEYSHSE